MLEDAICFAAIDWPKTIVASLIASGIATLISWILRAGSRDEAIRQARIDRPRQAEIEQAQRKEFEQVLKRVMVRIMLADGRADESEIQVVTQVYQQVSGTDLSVAELKSEISCLQPRARSIKECVRDIAPHLSDNGKALLMQAAFLVAASDGVLHDAEKQLLVELGNALRIPPQLSRVLSTVVTEASAALGIPRAHVEEVFAEIGKSLGCPQCRLRFGWDGTSCTHCQYKE